MDDALLRKAIAFESNGKLPFPPNQAMIRHIVAGEVYDKQEQKLETILMASPKAAVEEYLSAAARAKLDIVGLCAEPIAMVECFTRLGRRAEDTQAVTLYLDIGATGTRVLIAINKKVLFARSISIGGDEFNKAVAKEKGINFHEARLTRLQLGARDLEPATPSSEPAADPLPPSNENTFNFGAGIPSRSEPAPAPVANDEFAITAEIAQIFSVIRQPLDRLVSEIEMCRRYHEATFQNLPVQRIVFVGGEAKQRSLCANIAKRLGLPANVWDPVARLPRDLEHAMELGLNNSRLPDWAAVVGLSMGVKETE
jgi:type IV pilus assembly protein PilM